MNILITGVTGFIGKAFASLLADKHLLYGVTRTRPLSKVNYIPVVVDLLDPSFHHFLPEDIDVVVHFAQSSKYRDFPGGVADMLRINVGATVDLLEWARKTGVKQFFFASTANVYAPSREHLVETNQTIPESFYGATKLAAENMARQYHEYFQIDILRLFTVYGPGQKGMLISNMIERLRSREEITLAEGVGIYLTPVFVNDVISLIKQMIVTPDTRRNTLRVFNVCGDEVTSLAEIITTLEILLSQNSVIRFTDNDAAFFTGSNALLQKMIGGYKFVNLYDGLEMTTQETRLRN